MKYKKGEVDIIIPAFNARNTITKTLGSILAQEGSDEYHIYIVDDASTECIYDDIVATFGKYMDIYLIVSSINGGPGVARQIGIDAGNSEFITFIDADDTFAGALSISTMLSAISSNDCNECLVTRFDQLTENVRIQIPHQKDLTWMFGKMYRRKFLDDYKICFNNTRANEDCGFNTKVKLLCDNPGHVIMFINDLTYYWHENENSITRINNNQYTYDQCFCGWIDNMIDAQNHVHEYRPLSPYARQHAITVLMNAYRSIMECHDNMPVFLDQMMYYAKKYYWTSYKLYIGKVDHKALVEAYSRTINDSAGPSHISYMPYITLEDFINQLEESEFIEDEIYEIRSKIPEDLRNNNVKCGVCSKDYHIKPNEGG